MLSQIFSKLLLLWVVALLPTLVSSQRTPTLGLGNGFINLSTPSFSVQLVRDSQTLASLKPKGSASQTNNGTFDFSPFDQLTNRQFNGNYQLGDITFRARITGSGSFVSGDSSTARRPVTALSVSGTVLAAADLTPTLPSNSLLSIVRRWTLVNNTLALQFDVTNKQSQSVEIGSIGFPIVFNNIFTGRTSTNTNNNCSLIDPYIGNDAGFVQVMPLLGTLPPLVITPLGSTKTPFEAWRFLPESTSQTPFYQSQTFEGYYEWQTHTLAWAQNEWRNVVPWNAATSETLQPGQTRSFGLQFNLGTTIRDIDTTLANARRPVTVGIPGYIIPSDQTGKLFVKYSSAVQTVTVSPSNGLTLTANSEGRNGFSGFTVNVPTSSPALPARVRVTIVYADSTSQTVHYYVTQPSTQTISNLGNFYFQNQWFVNTTDPFHRSPSVISYDRDVNRFVTDDDRAWIPGLSDEAGAGSWLAAGMKLFGQPNAAEVTKYEQFINQTLWGSVQLSNGSSMFGVRKSVYFFEPALVPNYHYPTDQFNFGGTWDQSASFLLNRAYDYVHVTAAYWAMYRVARNYPTITTRPWQFYINQALQTVLFATTSANRVGFITDGLMGETVWRFLLDDLQREGLTTNATALQNAMQTRLNRWAGERFPFGSEMAWDSTGQEGVYLWGKFFNSAATRVNALNSILAYQPTVPHWGWNGNARRYWDNVFGGKLRRIERQIHHYGSGLNALPLISEFAANPTDWYLLRVGYGGISGPLSNIDSAGFAAASFHSWADTLRFDGYSGDYGPNFVGHSLNVGTFIINHPDFGWQAFGGTVTSVTNNTSVAVQIQDTLRRRIFVASFGLDLTLDSGAFSTAAIDTTAKTVTVSILPVAPGARNAVNASRGRLLVTKTATVSGIGNFSPTTSLAMDAGAFTVPFGSNGATVTLRSS